ncbi:MAG TPA: spore coat protein GerQ [Haloplasmataceae bacterium]
MNSFTPPNFPPQDTFQQTPGFQTPFFTQQTGYPQATPFMYSGTVPQVTPQGFIPFEQSYIENILRLNKDKIATVYMNFENSQWGSKIFKGAIEAAGKDHIILRDTTTNMRYLLLTIFLNYITFDEEINYEYPFALPNYPGTQLRKKESKEQNK